MESKSESQGRRIEIGGVYGDPLSLTLDGKAVEVSRDEDSGSFSSPLLPYVDFDSLESLAQALISHERELLP